MATILVVDDRPTNRDFLITLLGYRGHRLLEAADGMETLEVTRAAHPDLIISDILMPTMDGYTFVSQLRADTAIAKTPVIFYTANYLEREAPALARACGVTYLLVKPCDPADVLRTVAAVLPHVTQMVSRFQSETTTTLRAFIPTEKPAHRMMTELATADLRLIALIEFRRQLASELHPQRLLEGFCRAAGDLIGARLAVAGMLGEDLQTWRHFAANGLPPDKLSQLVPPPPRQGLLGRLLDGRRALRLHAPNGALQTLNFLPPSTLPIHSLLGVPIFSPRQLYGWLCLLDKLGVQEFTEEDELLAATLATEVAMAYENAMLYAEL